MLFFHIFLKGNRSFKDINWKYATPAGGQAIMAAVGNMQ
jgi:hypothetical protein